MTPLGQRDPRWAKVPLGSSNTSIGSHGCTITCIAMLAGTTPDIVNYKLKSLPKWADGSTGFKNGNLVIWSRIPEAFPSLTFVARANTYSNDIVKNNLPCLVEVDFDNSPNSFGNHWVLFIGNQKLLDPWTGTERSTGTYKYLKGYAIVKKKELVETSTATSPEPATETPSQPQTTIDPAPEPEPTPQAENRGNEQSTILSDNTNGTNSGSGSNDITIGMDNTINPFGGDTTADEPQTGQEVPQRQLPSLSIKSLLSAVSDVIRHILAWIRK